jgi:hypothetical protein
MEIEIPLVANTICNVQSVAMLKRKDSKFQIPKVNDMKIDIPKLLLSIVIVAVFAVVFYFVLTVKLFTIAFAFLLVIVMFLSSIWMVYTQLPEKKPNSKNQK